MRRCSAASLRCTSPPSSRDKERSNAPCGDGTAPGLRDYTQRVSYLCLSIRMEYTFLYFVTFLSRFPCPGRSCGSAVMVPWRGLNVRGRLLLVILLAVLPMVGLALVMAAEQRRLKTVDVQTHALQLVRVIATRHEQLIEGTRQLLTSLAHAPEVSGHDPMACI